MDSVVGQKEFSAGPPDFMLKHKLVLNGASDRLAVFLHGRTGSVKSLASFGRLLPENYAQLYLEGPLPDKDGGYRWWPLVPHNEMLTQAKLAVDHFLAALQQIEQHYNLAASFRVGIGFSQGAALLSTTLGLSSAASPFQALAFLCGFVFEDSARANDESGLSQSRIFMAHGEQDKIVPFEKAERGVTYLRGRGARVTFVREQTGHKLSSSGLKALRSWLSGL